MKKVFLLLFFLLSLSACASNSQVPAAVPSPPANPILTTETETIIPPEMKGPQPQEEMAIMPSYIEPKIVPLTSFDNLDFYLFTWLFIENDSIPSCLLIGPDTPTLDASDAKFLDWESRLVGHKSSYSLEEKLDEDLSLFWPWEDGQKHVILSSEDGSAYLAVSAPFPEGGREFFYQEDTVLDLYVNGEMVHHEKGVWSFRNEVLPNVYCRETDYASAIVNYLEGTTTPLPNAMLLDDIQSRIYNHDGDLVATISDSERPTLNIYSLLSGKLIFCDISLPGASKSDETIHYVLSDFTGTESSGTITFTYGPTAYRISYPGGAAEKLGDYMFYPLISPDGKYIAYSSAHEAPEEFVSSNSPSFPDFTRAYHKMDSGWYIRELSSGKTAHISAEEDSSSIDMITWIKIQ